MVCNHQVGLVMLGYTGLIMEKSQRYLKIVSGFTLLGVGVPLFMLPVPGPGVPAIMMGLALLAAEYVWARRLLDTVKRQGARIRSSFPSLPSMK